MGRNAMKIAASGSFFAAALLASVAFADSPAPPKGYLIAEITVTNPAAYEDYRKVVTPMVTRFGGTYLVRGGAAVAKEGAPPAGRVVVTEFASLAAAERFYHSPDYQAILPLRQRAATSRVFLVEGYGG